MGQLRDRMAGDLRLRGLAAVSSAKYLRCSKQFAAPYHTSFDQLGAEEPEP